jgi:hypothetical protein
MTTHYLFTALGGATSILVVALVAGLLKAIEQFDAP